MRAGGIDLSHHNRRRPLYLEGGPGRKPVKEALQSKCLSGAQ